MPKMVWFFQFMLSNTNDKKKVSKRKYSKPLNCVIAFLIIIDFK